MLNESGAPTCQVASVFGILVVEEHKHSRQESSQQIVDILLGIECQDFLGDTVQKFQKIGLDQITLSGEHDLIASEFSAHYRIAGSGFWQLISRWRHQVIDINFIDCHRLRELSCGEEERSQ